MATVKKRMRFSAVRKRIEREIEAMGDYPGRQTGRKREKIVITALAVLKKSGFIRDFIPPGDLSYPDVERGIDIFVVKVGEARYRVIPLSITGEAWAKEHREAHPNIPVIAVDLEESGTAIQEKIKEAIVKYQ